VSLSYISKDVPAALSERLVSTHRNAFKLGAGFDGSKFYKTLQKSPDNLWDERRGIFLTHGLANFVGYVMMFPLTESMEQGLHDLFNVIFWIDERSEPQVVLRKSVRNEDQGAVGWFGVARLVSRQTKQDFEHTLLLEYPHKPATLSVSVNLERSHMDGEPIYILSLVYEEIQRGDTLDG